MNLEKSKSISDISAAYRAEAFQEQSASVAVVTYEGEVKAFHSEGQERFLQEGEETFKENVDICFSRF